MRIFNRQKNKDSTMSWKYTPIKLFNFYILITLIISIFGPWNYFQYNKIYVVLYIFIFLCFSTMTYVYFVNKKKGITLVISKKWRIKNNFDGIWITKRFILISFLLFLAMMMIKVSEKGLPTSSNFFRLMAQVYTDKHLIGSKFNLSAWLFNYFSLFYIGSIVLGTYYFKYLNITYKYIYISVIILSIAFHVIFVGNQKALGDLIIYLGSITIVKLAQSGKKISLKVIILMIFVIIVITLLFSYIIRGRMNLWNVEYYSIGSKAYLNIDHWMLSLFNNNIKLGVGTFLYYLSSGYYGLSLTLELPFKWSYGFGSSFEMKYLFSKVFPLSDGLIQSYPTRMEALTGWDAYANWHTIFPWLASDFTFIGAIIFVCLFIATYAISWNRILKNGHWSNLLMFANLNIMLVYIPANNQLFQTRSSLIATLLIIILWIFNFNTIGGNNE